MNHKNPITEQAGVSVERDGKYRIVRVRGMADGRKPHDIAKTVLRIDPETWAWLVSQ